MRVVLCFFGLVKNVSDAQLAAYRTCVVEPFRSLGLEVVAMMHTHTVNTFTNTRNREVNVKIDQERSIAKLRTLCPWLILMQTPPKDASNAELDALLVNGDPWSNNPRESLKMYLRQLDSLRHLAFGLDAHGRKSDLLIVLRPDVMFREPMNAKDIVANYRAHPKKILTPGWGTYGGCNDRMAVGNRRVMVPYLLRGARLRGYVNLGNRPHAEKFLKFAIPNARPCIRTRFARVRADGRLIWDRDDSKPHAPAPAPASPALQCNVSVAELEGLVSGVAPASVDPLVPEQGVDDGP
jgi:hypothetical protein